MLKFIYSFGLFERMDLPEEWRRAGRIAGEARVYGASLIKEGVRFL